MNTASRFSFVSDYYIKTGRWAEHMRWDIIDVHRGSEEFESAA